jgi:upstream activation factor subunit UAF30
MAAKKKAKKAPAKKAKAKAGKRKPNAAFMKPVQPDAVLGAVVGSSPMPRTELTKKIWAYIKKNGLQDKKNRRNINADDKLKAVFGGKAQVNMFQMTALVAKHVK